jgi:FkbM family methyltransferase
VSAFSSRLGLLRSIAMYHGQPWRKRGLRKLYASFLRPGDLVFDVGAHVGNRSRIAQKLGARVVALEPQPLFADFLRRRAPNGLQVVEKAVGAAPGRATLRISRLHPTVSTLSAGWIETVGGAKGFSAVNWDGEAEVEVTTLDALIVEHGVPAFCKIDVEGLEAEILSGLSQPVEMVAFEYLPAALDVAQACLLRLAALGDYEFNLVEGEGWRFGYEDWLSREAMAFELGLLDEADRSGDVYARLRRSARRPGSAPARLISP